MKNYITDTDPTLRKTTIGVFFMWVIFIALIICSVKYQWIAPHPIPLSPPGDNKTYELNGYIPGTNQTGGQIR